MIKHKLICDSSYDYWSAEWSDTYRLVYEHTTIFGRKKWKRQVVGYHPQAGKITATGDLEWAKKIAKDLGIEVPKPNREHE